MRLSVHAGFGLVGVLALVAQGCVGNIGGDSDGVHGPGSGPQSCDGEVVPVAHVPLRRLDAEQYLNTLRDLFGDPEIDFALEDADGAITERAVRQIRDGAEIVASRRANWTAEVYPCDVDGQADDACVDTFIDGFGARAFRRPLDDEERAWLRAVYDDVQVDATFAESMDVVLQVMLQAPAALYMFEAGSGDAEGEMRRLSDYEIASRLSYFVWNSMPDEALFEAAAAGELSQSDGLRAHAERLLADPRAEHNIQRFFSGWLQLDGGQLHHPLESTDKDTTLYPEYDDALRAAMRAETEAFVRRTFFEEGASFDKLFTGTYAYVNGPLAALYGVDGPSDDSYQWVDLDSSERAGLLTRAAFLTVLSTKNVTAPIRRGVWVIEEALCKKLGDPPPNANDTPVEGGSVQNEDGEIEVRTVREDVEARTSDDQCAACHSVINPVGFSFENYDAIGRWQIDEVGTGLPVDASGKLVGSDVDGDLVDARDLSQRLAESEQVRGCFASMWAGTAFGQGSGTGHDFAIDSCSEQQIAERFAAANGSGGDMRELLLGIIDSNAFRFINISEESQ